MSPAGMAAQQEQQVSAKTDDKDTPRGEGEATSDQSRRLATSRIGRFGQVARLAGGVAGGMLAEGGRQLLNGNLPSARDMLLTPGNAKRLTRQLASMRGAAMKLGQMLSMDSGDLLPRELADILARLRSAAFTMPEDQLEKRLNRALGKDWREHFTRFETKPIAAASIGQVHRAQMQDGRDIVLKIQYPGVAKSIDSDIDNVATLLRMSGLLPRGIDIQPLLEDAKAQLRAEADYTREARQQQRFVETLQEDARFFVPAVVESLSGRSVLAMDHAQGMPIEQVAGLSQSLRDHVASALFELMLRELFELHYMQTDPNFANYLYDENSKRIVLLDFGATRRFHAQFSHDYADLLRAALAHDNDALCDAAERVGYSVGEPGSVYRGLLVDLFNIVLDPLRHDSVLDFGNADFVVDLAALGERVRSHREFWHAPPADALYLHRKIGGMYLLAARLKARVNVRELVLRWV
ncbi:MAG: AarF/ABC1/UbiB kinase family protein [Pseudomonadales bacterium]